MIIDSHGHFTTVPKAHTDWRAQQLAAFAEGKATPSYPRIEDEEIRSCVDSNQLAMMDERGIDVTIFSPQASQMGHHLGDASVSLEWTRRCNDLIHRVTQLFPERFVGVGQLPQSVDGGGIEQCVVELHRVVEELGFVGCNLNPDPSGGHWTSPPLTDVYWYPLYEAMVELDVPAMIHVSGSDVPACHTTGAFYIAADTTAFMQLIQGRLFDRFPTLRFIIPHGGGAVPFHWGRYRGLSDMLGQSHATELLRNVYFDTCVYHQPGIDFLLKLMPTQNLLFGSEAIGAVRGVDPESGHHFDDTKRYVDAAEIDPEQRQLLVEDNARRVYPRLNGVLPGVA